MLTLREIKGVGDATLKKLNELDVRSVFELFSFLPTKYIDLHSPISTLEAEPGQLALFEGIVEKVSVPSKRGKRSFYVSFLDAMSDRKIYFRANFFNMPFMQQSIKVGQRYRMLTRLVKDEGTLIVVNPVLERCDKLSKLVGVYPVYPLKGVMGQNAFKNIIYAALDNTKSAEYVGPLKEANELFRDCFEKSHRPFDAEEGYAQRERLAAIDMAICLSIYKKLKKSNVSNRKVFYKTEKSIIDKFIKALSFTPTPSQIDCMENICRRLSSGSDLSAIISGDVGSGKTVCAFFAMYLAAVSGRQAALMVPTEILALQHAKNFAPIAEKLGLRFEVLTASTAQNSKMMISDGLASGAVNCVIGTQSLLSDSVKFKNLSLAIIDEQHKFGVNERNSLEKKGACDVISLTATPIPRSLALSFYEDISVFPIKKREDAAFNVKTHIVKDVESGLKSVLDAVQNGKQAFIVCPAIKDAEGYDIMSIESFMRDFGSKFGTVKVEALHGKLSAEEKNRAMQRFSTGEISVIVATSMLEVGIDTSASEILILNADRFGLASLHQLRGRVGRDGSSANCYLQCSSENASALDRLRVLTESSDGQYLAETDFAMRGAGDFMGVRQSGASSTPIFGLKMTSGVLEEARSLSKSTFDKLSVSDLLALTHRSEARVRVFFDDIDKVTLNS